MSDDSLYTDGEYATRNASYHTEDSAWKAQKIASLLAEHAITPRVVAEIGCGAGQVIGNLSREPRLMGGTFTGYDISPQAIALAKNIAASSKGARVEYRCGDLLESAPTDIELLLSIDVFEHVPDYLGFLQRCRRLAPHHVLHIPLDLHVSSVLRSSFLSARASVGHLHYFTAESALATLRDAGYDVIASRLMNPARDLFWNQPTARRAVANAPRWLVGRVSESLSARIFGGYTLLVLARG